MHVYGTICDFEVIEKPSSCKVIPLVETALKNSVPLQSSVDFETNARLESKLAAMSFRTLSTASFVRGVRRSYNHRGYVTLAEGMRSRPNKWQGTSTSKGDTKLYINGQWVSSKTKKWIDVHDPVFESCSTKNVFWTTGVTNKRAISVKPSSPHESPPIDARRTGGCCRCRCRGIQDMERLELNY